MPRYRLNCHDAGSSSTTLLSERIKQEIIDNRLRFTVQTYGHLSTSYEKLNFFFLFILSKNVRLLGSMFHFKTFVSPV